VKKTPGAPASCSVLCVALFKAKKNDPPAPITSYRCSCRIVLCNASFSETPYGLSRGVLPSFQLFTPVRKGTSLKTDRTLSRRARTVQDMTVDSAKQPILPPVNTLRCDLRPSPGTTAWQPTKRRERFSRPGVHRLTVLWSLVRTSVSWLSRLLLSIQCMSRSLCLRAARLLSPWLKPEALRRGSVMREVAHLVTSVAWPNTLHGVVRVAPGDARSPSSPGMSERIVYPSL